MNKKQIAREKAEEIVSEAKRRNKFRGSVNVRETTRKPCFEGVIKGLENIDIGYNPGYPFHDVPYEDAFSRSLDFIVEHEMAHKSDGKGRGCPRDENLDINEVLTPMSLRLREKGLPNVPFGSQGHTLYTYFANLFEDFVVNTIVSDNRGSIGIFLDYDDMAHHSGGFPPLFEAFMKLQARTFPKKQGVSLMLQHCRQDEKAWKAVKGFLDRTGLRDVPRDERTDYLANPERWKELSDVFADEFSELVDLKDLAVSYFPLVGGNDFVRLNDEEVQAEIAVRAYGKEGGSFEPPPFLENNLALLSVYRQLAKQIDMKVQSHSVEVEMPVGHVARREFDFSQDPLEGLEYGVNERGKLEAQIGKWPLRVRSRYQVTAGTLPEVRVGLLDCSGSTKKSVNGRQGKVMNPWADRHYQWTDTSIYHYELLTVFGLCELFRRMGTLRSSNVKLGVFSDNTRMGQNLRDSEEKLLEPSFGGTRFDAQSIDELFRGNGSLVYTLSDGHVSNWGSVRERFIEGAKRHHYVHFQYGGETQMTRDLKAADLLVVRGDAEKSPQILVDFTQREVYGEK